MAEAETTIARITAVAMESVNGSGNATTRARRPAASARTIDRVVTVCTVMSPIAVSNRGQQMIRLAVVVATVTVAEAEEAVEAEAAVEAAAAMAAARRAAHPIPAQVIVAAAARARFVAAVTCAVEVRIAGYTQPDPPGIR